MVLGAASLTVLAATAVSSVYLLRNVRRADVCSTGASPLVAGVAITLIALDAGLGGRLFFAGTAVSGIGFGGGFQGGIRTVVPQAAPHERAGVLSLLFVVSYLGMGVPAVAAGSRGAPTGSACSASARDYGIAADRAGRGSRWSGCAAPVQRGRWRETTVRSAEANLTSGAGPRTAVAV